MCGLMENGAGGAAPMFIQMVIGQNQDAVGYGSPAIGKNAGVDGFGFPAAGEEHNKLIACVNAQAF